MSAVLPLPQPIHALDFEPLELLAARALPGGTGPLVREPMPGGASTRLYFRVRRGTQTAVAMFVPDGPKPEEIAKAGADRAATRWPFLEVRDLLASHGVDVPAIYGEDTAHGWLLLEDLGDETLAVVLGAHPHRKTELYQRAIEDLARAQRSLARVPETSVVAHRAFDEDLLLWEMHHFREWGLEARGIVLSAEARTAFDTAAERLAKSIAAYPRGFVHRDYQSRNLMVRPDGALCWIDFQDALLGPRVYDLVALLNDSYQVFEPTFVEARLDDYARAAGLDTGDRAELGLQFDRVTVQRKLKDAGRFVFIDRVKGNPRYLKFVEPTIAKVRSSLARLADDPDMRTLVLLLERLGPA